MIEGRLSGCARESNLGAPSGKRGGSFGLQADDDSGLAGVHAQARRGARRRRSSAERGFSSTRPALGLKEGDKAPRALPGVGPLFG
jgi:hypothetical protein